MALTIALRHYVPKVPGSQFQAPGYLAPAAKAKQAQSLAPHLYQQKIFISKCRKCKNHTQSGSSTLISFQ